MQCLKETGIETGQTGSIHRQEYKKVKEYVVIHFQTECGKQVCCDTDSINGG